jgi:hypothetical protein
VKQVRRRYRPGTRVLETECEVEGGVVRLVDCMPTRSGTPDLVRMVVDEARAWREWLLLAVAGRSRPDPNHVWAKRLVGYFPQAFSHAALISTAGTLSRSPGPADIRPKS